MIFEWDDEKTGELKQHEIRPGGAIVGMGFERLILDSKDMETFAKMPDDKLAFYIKHLATRTLVFR